MCRLLWGLFNFPHTPLLPSRFFFWMLLAFFVFFYRNCAFASCTMYLTSRDIVDRLAYTRSSIPILFFFFRRNIHESALLFESPLFFFTMALASSRLFFFTLMKCTGGRECFQQDDVAKIGDEPEDHESRTVKSGTGVGWSLRNDFPCGFPDQIRIVDEVAHVGILTCPLWFCFYFFFLHYNFLEHKNERTTQKRKTAKKKKKGKTCSPAGVVLHLNKPIAKWDRHIPMDRAEMSIIGAVLAEFLFFFFWCWLFAVAGFWCFWFFRYLLLSSFSAKQQQTTTTHHKQIKQKTWMCIWATSSNDIWNL